MDEIKKMDIDEPTISKPFTNINDVMDNPGFSEITLKILCLLGHNSLLAFRLVCKSWKNQLNYPYLWIKKLHRKGQTIDLQNSWLDLLQRIEKDSSLELEIIKCLMKFHQEINFWRPNALQGILPIHIATVEGCLEVVMFIVSYSEEPNPPKEDGWTPMNLAVCFGQTEIYKFLSTKVENFNAPNPVHGITPLHYAARNGYTEMFKFIASKVENPNLPRQNGWTPIHLAARYGHTEIIKFLTTKVENFNAPNPNGFTPLHSAARYGYTEMFIFIATKLYLKPIFYFGFGFLMLILSNFIVSYSEEPNPSKEDGWTPINLAARHGHT